MSNKIKVLIVEDDFILYQQLSEYFEERGYEIVREDEDKAVDNYDDALRLIKQYKPDIAILDIVLKGIKDGIHLGAFIKEHYDIPVIYLSAYNTPGNLERIRHIGEERFVLKVTKPLNTDQLWAAFYLALPHVLKKEKEKTIGQLFKLKEIASLKSDNQQKMNYDPLELKKFVQWDEIKFFKSYNASSATGNNNIMLNLSNGKSYSTRGTITATEQQIPAYFARTDNSTIVNMRKITAFGKTYTFCLIGEDSFSISEKYRKTVLEKINMYMSSNT